LEDHAVAVSDSYATPLGEHVGHHVNGRNWLLLGGRSFITSRGRSRIRWIWTRKAGMFAVYGDRVALEQLRELIDPYLVGRDRVAATLRQAEASVLQFDD
jgi:hypothetical protein